MSEKSSLLPPNATALERAMESITNDLMSPIDFDCRTLWRSETCPTTLLPWLAGALGLDDWDDQWPEHIKRSTIANAIDIQSTKGTIHSIKTAVSTFGVTTVVREYRDNPNDLAPCQYKITAAGGTASIQKSMEKALQQTVRASDSFILVNGTSGGASLNMIGVGRSMTLQRFNCSVSY